MTHHSLSSFVVAICFLMLTGASDAQQGRHVHLNGQHLSIQQIIALDRQVGTVVPNGAYWVDYRSGYWGYEGNPRPQGRIVSRSANRPRQPGYNRSGPFGDSMSDGKCAFVNGVPVGDCN